MLLFCVVAFLHCDTAFSIPPTPAAADGAAGSNAADSANASLVNGTSPTASSRSPVDGHLSLPPPTVGWPLPVLERTDLGCAWAAPGHSSSHMGQVLKREATTGNHSGKMALALVGPLTPSGALQRDTTLASDLAPRSSAPLVWPSPKHVPAPALGRRPGVRTGLKLASGSPLKAPVLDSKVSLRQGDPGRGSAPWPHSIAWLSHW